MKLNEDILQAAGTDDIPIIYLELTAQQLERIVLARAIYCTRQIVLLDEPFTRFTNHQEAKELFLQLVHCFEQDHKTVIMVTRCDDVGHTKPLSFQSVPLISPFLRSFYSIAIAFSGWKTVPFIAKAATLKF